MTTDGAYARLALYAPHQGGQSALIDSRARTSCQTTPPKCGEGRAPSAQHYDSVPYLEPRAGAAVPGASPPRKGGTAGGSPVNGLVRESSSSRRHRRRRVHRHRQHNSYESHRHRLRYLGPARTRAAWSRRHRREG